MSVQSNKSSPQTCVDSPNATSSPELEDGVVLCDSPDGRTTDQSGPSVAPASPSATPEQGEDSQTHGTCGLGSFPSPLGVALHRSLENRLKRRLGEDRQINLGTTSYHLTWVTPVTSSQVRYSRLFWSVLPTSERDCILWPTPTASSPHERVNLLDTARSMDSGQTQNGSDTKTKDSLLNPSHSLWLMGYPDTWLSCGVQAMRSFHSKLRSS
jgi:hypothetical protein